MSFLGITLLVAAVAAGPVLRFWERVPAGSLPAQAVAAICGGDAACRANVTRGPAYRADVNSDGKHEYLVPTGCDAEGCRFDILAPSGDGWKSIFEPRQTPLLPAQPAPGEIFPRQRSAYRDFRVNDVAFKWTGSSYGSYRAADYRAIQPGWLNEQDASSAILLWLRDYAGLKEFTLVPRYLPGSFGELPAAALSSRVSDSKTRTEWVSFLKGNVWADQPKQERRFFVLPPLGRPAPELKIAGDYLVVYVDGQEAARVHRRTLRVKLARPLGE